MKIFQNKFLMFGKTVFFSFCCYFSAVVVLLLLFGVCFVSLLWLSCVPPTNHNYLRFACGIETDLKSFLKRIKSSWLDSGSSGQREFFIFVELSWLCLGNRSDLDDRWLIGKSTSRAIRKKFKNLPKQRCSEAEKLQWFPWNLTLLNCCVPQAQ